jgi:aromatic ring-opening dioxygenase LigB subunit
MCRDADALQRRARITALSYHRAGREGSGQMPIVFGAVAPHGFPIIPDISKDADGALRTRDAMLELGRRFDAANVDVIVIAGPHGIRVNEFIMLADCGRAAGTLRWDERAVEMNVPLDMPLTRGIAQSARERGVAVATAGYAASNPESSVYPLDWGIMTPLWFCGHAENQTGHGYVLADKPASDSGPTTVIVNPSRLLPREQMLGFGRAVAEAARVDGRRVAFIASCDWAHRHADSGPYGFHPDAKRMDDEVVAAIKANQPASLIGLDDEYVRNAAIDGLWQLLMLAGVMEVVPMDVDFLSYEAPTYYGMIVATYKPTSA